MALRTEIAKVVVGQDAVVSGLVIALLCRGHVLLEGVPGVAKTLLVRTLAAALQLEFKRVQFTPDLMPGDVTGSLVYDARTAEFEFRAGPVFTNLLLADEINRTPPKTQAALLEAMEERQVSVDGDPRPLPDPFIVAATQNPIEYEGTYQLPEAQLDRFLLKLNVPLPPRDQEIAILDRHARGFDPRDLSAVQAGGRCRRAGGRTRGGAAGAGGRRGARLHRRHRRCHTAFAVAAARRVPARRDRAAGHRAVLGVAVGPQLRDARRRQGDGRARRCGTGSRCAPRPNWRARPPTACSTASWPPSRCPASGAHRPRRPGGAAVRAADRAIRPGPQRRSLSCWRCWWWRWRWTSRWRAVPAAAVHPVRATTAARLGQPVDAALTSRTPADARFRGLVRDAWPPQRARRATHPPGGHRCGTTRFRSIPGCGRCAGAISSRHWSPPARSVRSALPAGRARTGCRGRSGSCRRSCPASTCRRGWPGCASWTAWCRC